VGGGGGWVIWFGGFLGLFHSGLLGFLMAGGGPILCRVSGIKRGVSKSKNSFLIQGQPQCARARAVKQSKVRDGTFP